MLRVRFPAAAARRAAGVPDGDGGDRAAVRHAGSGHGGALVDPRQPGEPVVRCRVGRARGARHDRPGEVPVAVGVAEVITPDVIGRAGIARGQGSAHLAGGGRASRRPARGPPGRATGRSTWTPTCPISASRSAVPRRTRSPRRSCRRRNRPVAKRLAAAGRRRAARRGCGCPPRRSRAAAFAPDADLRGPRDLPVLIVGDRGRRPAGRRRLASWRAGWPARRLPPRWPTAPGRSPGDPPLAGGTVALFNRGTPSGVVTPDGTLWMTLLRACSGWPSGVWIDGDRRTAPDGSSFAWQHWSHTFSYALGRRRRTAGGGRVQRGAPRTTTTT